MDNQMRLLKLVGIAVIVLTYIAAMPASGESADSGTIGKIVAQHSVNP